MRWWAAGLWHVRGGSTAILAVLIGAGVTFTNPDMVIGVSLTPGVPTRGVGTVEIVGVPLAAVLPALTTPDFSGRELRARGRVRAVHAAISMTLIAAPLLLLAVWYASLATYYPVETLQPVTGLLGNLLVTSCFAGVACLVVGRMWSVPLTLAAYAGLVVCQHLFPDSPATTLFATNDVWHTSWWLCGGAVALTWATVWRLRSTPLSARKT